MKPWGLLHGLYGFNKLDEEEQQKLENIAPSRGLENQKYDLEGNRNLGVPLEERIADLEEFNRILRSDIIDMSLLEAFLKKKNKRTL